VGQPCQFIDGSSDSDGNIASRAWTFEGGTPPSSTAQNPSVVFATEGAKTVTLVVTDNDGAQDTETKSVTVSAPSPATPSASESDVSVTPNAVPANGTPATITVIVRDASGTRLAGVAVSASSSDARDQITPASTTSGANGEATFTFSSTAAGEKTITVTAAGVTLNDQPRIQVAALGSSVNITGDAPDPSTSGQVIRVTFAVTGEGGGTPTGTVEIFSLAEAGVGCTVPAAQGFCDFALNTPGLHQLGAAYSGDAQYQTSSDEDGEAHEVTAPPGT
jgi:PKD repeat protein